MDMQLEKPPKSICGTLVLRNDLVAGLISRQTALNHALNTCVCKIWTYPSYLPPYVSKLVFHFHIQI